MTARSTPLARIRLKKAGGSLVMTVPAAARQRLDLVEGQELSISVENDRLVLEPSVRRPRYALDELMAQCDLDAPSSELDAAWLADGPVGREVL